MPAGAGSYGRHGIWLYGEEDTGPMFSDTLNKGQQSVIDALDDRDDDRAVVTATRNTIGAVTANWVPFVFTGQQTYGTGLSMPMNGQTVTAARPMLVQLATRIAIDADQQLAVQVTLNGTSIPYAQEARAAAGTTWTASSVNAVIPLSSGDQLQVLYRLFSGSSAQLLRDQCFLSVVELRSLV